MQSNAIAVSLSCVKLNHVDSPEIPSYVHQSDQLVGDTIYNDSKILTYTSI